MKKNKLFLTAFTCVFCLSNLAVYAKPEVEFNFNLESGITEMKINAKPDTYAIIQFLDASEPELLDLLDYDNIGSVLKYAVQVATDSDGKAQFTYNIPFPSGNYRAVVSDGSRESWLKDFYYFSSEDQKQLFEDIKAAFSNPAELCNITEANAAHLNLDTALYEELKKTEDAAGIYTWLIKQNMPQTIDEYSKMFDEAVKVYAFAAAETSDVIAEYLEKFEILPEFKKIYNDFLTDAERKSICDELAACSEFINLKQINNIFGEKCIFYACKINSYLEFDKIMESGKTIIGERIYAAYYNLNESRQIETAKQVCKNTLYKNYSEWLAAFEKEINKKPSNSNTESGGNSGGSGGSGGSKKNNTPAAEIKITEQLPKADEIETAADFYDLEQFQWAENAIKQLAKAKIVYGREEGKFCPGEGVTREEFLAMLMRAFEIETDGYETDFSDVSKDKWYYEVISAAQKLGLTKGIGDGKFGVGKRITRQEMCVLAYRFAKNSNVEFKNIYEMPFKDNIAEYAHEAISALYSADIVSGVGGNEFLPEIGANRAEAAKIIYSLLSYANKI